MNNIKDFIINFPLYVKTGVLVIWFKIKDSGINLRLKIKKLELKGQEMQDKGKKMLLEVKEDKKRFNQK